MTGVIKRDKWGKVLEAKFEEIFNLQRKNISILERKYEKNLEKVRAGIDEYPNRDLTATRKGVKTQIWAPDGKLSNEDTIMHKSSCLDRKTFEGERFSELHFSHKPDKIVDKYAQILHDKSAVLRKALNEYQGFWWDSVTALETASYVGAEWPNPSEKWGADYPFDLSLFDFLVPGLDGLFLQEVINSKIRIDEKADGSIFQIYIGNRPMFRTGTLSRPETVKRIMELVYQRINDFRADCVHPQPTLCGLCGNVTEPVERVNAQFILPQDFCPWCVLVLDHHDDIPLLYDGIDDDLLKDSMLESFTRLVEITEFPYWKTPVLTRKLIVELGLRWRDRATAIEISHLLACIPKRSTLKRLFETPQHFFHAAGLEDLVPRGRGRGIRSISRCGHLCLSNGEREICEYLNENQIEHSKEPVYSDLVGGDLRFGSMRGDFLVQGIVVEFAGLDGDAGYDLKMATKVSLAGEHNLSVIVLKPSDLKNLSKTLPISLFAE